MTRWEAIRRCGFVGDSVTLGVDFEVSDAQTSPVSLSLPSSLSDNLSVDLSASSPVPYLPVCCHASRHNNNGLSSEV